MEAAADMTASDWTDYVDEFYDFYDSKTGGSETFNMPLTLTIKGLTSAQCPGDDASDNFETEYVTSSGACEFDFGQATATGPSRTRTCPKPHLARARSWTSTSFF